MKARLCSPAEPVGLLRDDSLLLGTRCCAGEPGTRGSPMLPPRTRCLVRLCSLSKLCCWGAATQSAPPLRLQTLTRKPQPRSLPLTEYVTVSTPSQGHFFSFPKVHVNLLLVEARMQAELLYALRAITRYMT